MNEKACCVTGHRDIPADKADYVKAKLKEEIEQAIADGSTTFTTGSKRKTPSSANALRAVTALL